MSWRDLLHQGPEERTAPWVGGRGLASGTRRWRIEGKLPPEHGWHRFRIDAARKAVWAGPGDADPQWDEGRDRRSGYLVGNRLIPDGARVDPDPDKLVHQTLDVALVEPGLDRFARAVIAREPDGPWIFVRSEFPLGPESDVAAVFADRGPTVAHVPGVPPGLDLAFRFCTWQRDLAAERRRRAEERLAEELRERERQARLGAMIGSGEGRRELAADDFEAAARAALALSGAELLDHHPGYERGEQIVLFRFRGRRFECVADAALRIVDSGICLTDHHTGEKGDTRFTLESLPGVIGEAIDNDVLVVFRHPDG